MPRHSVTGKFQRNILCSALAVVLVAGTAMTAVHAQGAAEKRPFDVPAQTATSALNTFAEQADITLVFSQDDVAGIVLGELDGSYSINEALERLLAGTGLVWGTADTGAIAISRSESGVGGSAGQQSMGTLSEVRVVGSQIAGGGAEAALPVIVMSREDIEATGAVDGNELIRSMPQMGDVTWNPTYVSGSSNAPRGDMQSINLKNLGSSNTLLLINGRRSVIHSTTTTVDGGVYTTAYNSNAIPMFGLDRIEVLMDGAAAIYGSDAIAGVVNLVTQSNLANGGVVKLQYGSAEGTHRSDSELSGYFGRDFAGGRGNVSVMYSLSHRTPQYAGDEWYTATSDRRSFLDGTSLEGANALDARSTSTPWARLQVTGSDSVIYRGGTAISNASGYFHIQPSSNSGCLVDLGDGICIDDGSLATSGDDRNLRYDTSAEDGIMLSPTTDRANLFSNFRYSVNDGLEFFGEAGYYYAKTRRTVSSATTSTIQPITIPATAYWNPLGALYLPDGSLNPNRINGLDNVLDDGVDLILSNYRLADGGPLEVKVNNMQYRLLAGLRGWTGGGFDWESAVLYSRARSVDDSEGYSATKFVEALSGTTADAYNPFNGGSLENTSVGDDTANSRATIDAFKIWTRRKTTTELALWDFKVSKPDLLSLPAGDLGLAAGVELRFESLEDDRDPYVDGTHTYTDWYAGSGSDSDLMGTSPTPDTYGSRNVKSAFVEVSVPLVSPDFNVPLVKSLSLQIAGRYESYSDVGDIAKPKAALAWQVADSLLLRGSWSQGFKAPNLHVINSAALSRFNSRIDYIRCEAQVRNGSIASYADCSQSFPVPSLRSGNSGLVPEESENVSFGAVFSPQFLPDGFGSLTLSADWWQIDIDNEIGMLLDQDALIVDLYERVVNGSSNPNVVRLDPTADDIALFAGTGLTAIGEVDHVTAQYENMAAVHAEGLSFAANWRLTGTRWGDFNANVNVSRLLKYQQELPDNLAAALAAQQAGLLDGYINIGTSDQVGRDGAKPAWKASGSVIWKYGNGTMRLSTNYIGDLYGGNNADGSGFLVDSTQVWNTSYRHDFTGSPLDGFSVEFGARNVFDKQVPLNSSGIYLANLYEPYGRYLYAAIEKKF